MDLDIPSHEELGAEGEYNLEFCAGGGEQEGCADCEGCRIGEGYGVFGADEGQFCAEEG